MVRHHVAQGAGHLVELASLLHADRLRRGDLHVVDPVAVPDRFKNPVSEAERHDVLHGVLADEMVDPENLLLVQRAQDASIEFARRTEIMAERLLDHDATPELGRAALLGHFHQLTLTHSIDDRAAEPICDRDIEDDAARRIRLFPCIVQLFYYFKLATG